MIINTRPHISVAVNHTFEGGDGDPVTNTVDLKNDTDTRTYTFSNI